MLSYLSQLSCYSPRKSLSAQQGMPVWVEPDTLFWFTVPLEISGIKCGCLLAGTNQRKSLGVLTWNVAVGTFPVSDRLGIHSLAVISKS